VKTGLRDRLGVGAALSIILLAAVATGGIAYLSTGAVTGAFRWEQDSYQVRDALSTLLADVEDAESDARGYALTGDGAYLAAFDTARVAVADDATTLRTLTADNPAQQRNLDGLAPQLDRTLTDLQASIDARQRAGLPAAVATDQSGGGERGTTAIRASIAAMEAEERRLLAQRTARVAAGVFRARLVVVGGSLLTCLSVALTWAVLGRSLARRARAEEALRESEARHRSLVELSPDLIAVHRDGVLNYINPAGVQLLGAAGADELAGVPVLSLFDGGDGEPAHQLLHEVYAAGRPRAYAHVRARRRDGRAIDAEMVAVPITDRGEPARLVVMRDITTRLRAEEERAERVRAQAARADAEARAEARALYEATAVHLADGLAIVDREQHIVFWNPRMEEIYGVAASRAVGRLIAEQTLALYAGTEDPADTAQRSREAYATAMRTGTPAVFEYTHRREATSPRDLEVLVFPITGPDGPLGHGRLVRDVTKERDVDRLKDELVSVVSHELRTPLASLVGFAELLLARDFPVAQRRQFLETMLQEGQRLTALINDFLDLQRIESGRQELVPVPTALGPLLHRAATAVGDDAARPVALDLPADLPMVLADPDRLQQVVVNLLGNARKYSPQGGAVTITASVGAGALEVAVADQGLGLPPEALPRLFRSFYRVDNSDRRAIKGTGLGLAISRKIVEAHGGRIRAESAGLGRGSTFRFTVPLATASAVDRDVLVVEDDDGFARLLAAALAEHGHSSARVAGAEAALADVARSRPRAVVLDLLLPGLSGEGFLRRLRDAGEHLPVVVVTVRDLDAAARQALAELGVTAVLRKGPGVAPATAAAVDAALEATLVAAVGVAAGEASAWQRS
jgi:PAS domain S-box-containing protein